MTRWLPVEAFIALTIAVASCTPAPEQNGEPMNEAADTTPDYEPPPVAAESHDLTQDDIERLMDELSNWGRWGPDDELGAANLITPAKRLEAVSLVTEGITVSLAHQLLIEEADDVPLPFQRRMLNVPDLTVEPPMMGAVSDNYSVSYHGYSHSHIDSLCHIMYKGLMYNGVSQDTITEDGCSNASIANLQGGIVTRGVLFDIPRLTGAPYLDPGTPIYMEDLEAWEEYAGVTIEPGDALLLRTGRWARRAANGETGVMSGWDASAIRLRVASRMSRASARNDVTRPICRRSYPVALRPNLCCCLSRKHLFSDRLRLSCRLEPVCVEAEYSGGRLPSSSSLFW